MNTVNTMILAEIGKVSPSAPPGAGKFEMLLGWVMWAAMIGSIIGIVIAGVYLAYQRSQGGGGDAQAKIGWAMVGAVIIGTAAGIVNMLVL